VSIFQKISLLQFRNYSQQSFYFDKKIVGICGANGTGKTNLLDTIYYLCFTKSYFSKPDGKNVMHGKEGFRIEAEVENIRDTQKLTCILRENGRKEFYLDDEQYKKFSDHIGKYTCVMIAPDDAMLITGGSEERRKFLDTLLSQIYPDYLAHLINYNRILLQRNSYLKNLFEEQKTPDDLLDVLDEQLACVGEAIFLKRKIFLDTFISTILNQYESIADKDEGVDINYQTQMVEGKTMLQLLKDYRQRDLYLQRTTAGIHKDEIFFSMNEQPFKLLASQGQRKSLLFALKLAEYFSIKEIKNHAPILLLDDVFEKLDANRMMNLLQKVCKDTDTQIFITDTHKERLEMAFDVLCLDYQLIEL
jgi:DNA replication and repair protein RecF